MKKHSPHCSLGIRDETNARAETLYSLLLSVDVATTKTIRWINTGNERITEFLTGNIPTKASGGIKIWSFKYTVNRLLFTDTEKSARILAGSKEVGLHCLPGAPPPYLRVEVKMASGGSTLKSAQLAPERLSPLRSTPSPDQEHNRELELESSELATCASPHLSRKTLDELGQENEDTQDGDNFPLHSTWTFWFDR